MASTEETFDDVTAACLQATLGELRAEKRRTSALREELRTTRSEAGKGGQTLHGQELDALSVRLSEEKRSHDATRNALAEMKETLASERSSRASTESAYRRLTQSTEGDNSRHDLERQSSIDSDPITTRKRKRDESEDEPKVVKLLRLSQYLKHKVERAGEVLQRFPPGEPVTVTVDDYEELEALENE